MTLPASEQRALNAIGDVLRRGDPRLATMFGVFTELTRLEAMPPAETLEPAWWRCRAGRAGPILVLPFLLMAAVSLVILGLLTGPSDAPRRCGQAVALIAPARLSAPAGCRPATRARVTQPAPGSG